MADLSLTVDVSSLTQAQKRLKDFQNQMGKSNSVIGLSRAVGTLENQIQELVRAKEKGRISSQTYEKGLLELKRQYEQLGYSSQKATAAVRKYAQQLADQRAAEAAARAARSQADRLRELRMRYREGYAAQVRMRRALMELNEAYQRGVISQEEYLRMQQRIREGNQGNVRSMNAMGMATQQVGYQVGDFLVQVQSGTNVMVALGQQATQLVGILPLMADSLNVSAGRLIAISAGLGIVIPLVTALGAAFMRTREATDESSESVEHYTDVVRELRGELEALDRVQKGMSLGLNAQGLSAFEAIQGAERDVREAKKALQELNEELDLSRDLAEVGVLSPSFNLQNLGSILGITKSQAEVLNEALINYKTAVTTLNQLEQEAARGRAVAYAEEESALNNQIRLLQLKQEFGQDSVEVIKEEARQRKIAYGQQVAQLEISDRQKLALIEMNSEIVDTEVQTELAKRQAELLAENFDVSLETARLLAGLDIASPIADAAAAAKLLGDNLALANSMARNYEGREDLLPNAPFESGMTRGTGFGVLTDADGNLMTPSGEDLLPTSGTGSRGGSRGGGASGVGQDVFGFARQFMGEEDQAQVWYDQQLEKLQEFNEQELDILRRHGINKATIEQEYQNRVAEIRGQQNQAALGAYSQLFGNIATIAEAGGKKMVAVQKIAAVAQGLINAYLSYTNIMASPLAKSNPVLAKVLAVSSLAAGLAQVANIRATSYGSSGGGGGGRGASGGGASAAIATPQAASQAPQRVVIEGLDPSALYSGEMIQSIFDAIYDENEERGAVFMVAT